MNFNFYRAITNPRVIGTIIGFIILIMGLGNAGGNVLVNAVLFLGGLGIIFASVAPEAFQHFVEWLTNEISKA